MIGNPSSINRRNSQRGICGKQNNALPKEECIKSVYGHPVYLTFMQSTLCKMLGWMNPKLESRLSEEISTTSDMQIINLMAESKEELKSHLMIVKEESEKAVLKLNIQKIRPWHLGPSLQSNRCGKSGNSDIFSFLGLQNYCGR